MRNNTNTKYINLRSVLTVIIRFISIHLYISIIFFTPLHLWCQEKEIFAISAGAGALTFYGDVGNYSLANTFASSIRSGYSLFNRKVSAIWKMEIIFCFAQFSQRKNCKWWENIWPKSQTEFWIAHHTSRNKRNFFHSRKKRTPCNSIFFSRIFFSSFWPSRWSSRSKRRILLLLERWQHTQPARSTIQYLCTNTWKGLQIRNKTKRQRKIFSQYFHISSWGRNKNKT